MWISASRWVDLSKGRQLLRGAKWDASQEVIPVASPINRKPKNMPLHAHEQIDDYFESRFGVRFRSRGLFTTGDAEIARSYGSVRCLVPKADFCFCWSPFACDLFGEFLHRGANETYEGVLDRLSYRCDDLCGAIESRNEVMLVGAAFDAFALKSES